MSALSFSSWRTLDGFRKALGYRVVDAENPVTDRLINFALTSLYMFTALLMYRSMVYLPF
ncbi:hypothetical protein [uncultured Corynebacterium sp.]|uniref:hypothetical protein n=1 Tax=uncultured Corynebacterium sp. TaxID=159447 RepID=UPI0025D7051B|nr:hypothetical protein [uncultured Corynebacterium sp.]